MHTTPTPTIREAHPNTVDLAELQAFAARTFPAACPAWLPHDQVNQFIETSLSYDQFSTWIADPNSRVLVAEQDGRIAAYTACLHAVHTDGPEQFAGARSAYLSKLYLDPTLRGSGLARALLERTIADARADHCAGLWLGVNDENERARAFYRKSGLDAVGRREFTVGSHVFTDDFMAIRFEN